MGVMLNGEWWADEAAAGEAAKAPIPGHTTFRDWISADGAAAFKAEPGRYHLYISHACPWAHRTLIVRRLKKLEDAISLSVVYPRNGPRGWPFDDYPGAIPDTVNGARYLYEVYAKARPGYTGRVSVPALWDRETGTIVNNESAEIIRMFNSAFDEWGDRDVDLYPEALRGEIEAVNEAVLEHVNAGVYKAGFASGQAEYERAYDALFATLDDLEMRLGRQRYLAGDRVTEADWRLFTTLVRFDSAYYGAFKCNKRRLVEYPNLWGFTRELFQLPGIAGTVDLDHIKQAYYGMAHINPTGIVPAGPDIDFSAPHGRDGMA